MVFMICDFVKKILTWPGILNTEAGDFVKLVR